MPVTFYTTCWKQELLQDHFYDQTGWLSSLLVCSSPRQLFFSSRNLEWRRGGCALVEKKFWTTLSPRPLSPNKTFSKLPLEIDICINRKNRRRLTCETFSGHCPISRLSIWWTQESSPHGSERPSSDDVLKQDTVHRNLPLIYLYIQWLHPNCLLLVSTKYWKLTLYTFRFKTKKSDKKKREIRREKIDLPG